MDTPAVGASRWQRLVERIEDGLLVLLLAAMIALAAVQIVLRNVFEAGLVWGEPLTRLLVLWVGLSGAVVASRLDRHIHVNVLARLLPARLQHAARVLTDAFTSLVCAVVAWHAARFVAAEYPAGTEAFDGVPVWVAALVLPVGFGVIALRYALHARAHARALRQRERGGGEKEEAAG